LIEHASNAPGRRLARSRNVLAASHTIELAARFRRGLVLGGYLNSASLALHAALRVALASAEMMPGGVAMYGFDTEGKTLPAADMQPAGVKLDLVPLQITQLDGRWDGAGARAGLIPGGGTS